MQFLLLKLCRLKSEIFYLPNRWWYTYYNWWQSHLEKFANYTFLTGFCNQLYEYHRYIWIQICILFNTLANMEICCLFCRWTKKSWGARCICSLYQRRTHKVPCPTPHGNISELWDHCASPSYFWWKYTRYCQMLCYSKWTEELPWK